MYLPRPDEDGLQGVQKHHVSGLLYIGNFQAAEEEIAKALKSNSTPEVAIVCCTTGYRKGPKKLQESVETAKNQEKLRHLDIAFGDVAPDVNGRVSDDELNDLFQQAYKFIDDAIKNNIQVLVHCDQGSTRSATLIVAYLMRSANLTLAEAEERVKKIRRITVAYDYDKKQNITVSYANIDNFRDFLVQREKEFRSPDIAAASSASPSDIPENVESISPRLALDTMIDKSVPPKLLAKVFPLENRLDTIVTTMANQHENKAKAYNDIYDLFHSNLQLGDKESWYRLTVNELQTKLSDITQLFHTLIQHKDKIDLHKHSTIDLFLFKDKSTSWQSLIKKIRNDAFSLLQMINTSMPLKDCPSNEIVEYLKTQRNNPLFCLHRGNHWYEKFGETETVKYINTLIANHETMPIRLN